MHAINSGFTVTRIKTIVAHSKTEYKCNTRKCRHMQFLMIAMVI
jgi:hypothetical protein